MHQIAPLFAALALLMGCGNKSNDQGQATSSAPERPAELALCRDASVEIVGKQLTHPGGPLNSPKVTPEIIKSATLGAELLCTGDQWTAKEAMCAMRATPSGLSACFTNAQKFKAFEAGMNSRAPK